MRKSISQLARQFVHYAFVAALAVTAIGTVNTNSSTSNAAGADAASLPGNFASPNVNWNSGPGI